MNENSCDANNAGQNGVETLLPWAECDYFCIHDYADTGASRCGWRGRLRDTQPDVTRTKLLCPRCGCATLLRIPSNRSNGSGAHNL